MTNQLIISLKYNDVTLVKVSLRFYGYPVACCNQREHGETASIEADIEAVTKKALRDIFKFSHK